MTRLAQMLQIIRSPSIGPITFYYLQKKFNYNLKEICKFLENNHKTKLISMNSIEHEIEETQKLGAKFLICDDFFKVKSHDLPPVIIYKGNLELLNNILVAIVGTRNSSVIGNKFTIETTKGLGKKNCTIASGLAIGIDTLAHIHSINSGTIGFLPGDINTPYPISNRLLINSIEQQGLLVTQQPLGTKIASYHFPIRNKLMAALCHICLVIESTIKSGALDSAKKFLNYKKPVYTVPGHPYEYRYSGNNYLLTQGCRVLRNIEDIDLNIVNKCEDIMEPMDDIMFQEKKNHIINQLCYTAIHIDDLVSLTNYKIEQVLCILGQLQLDDKIVIENNYVTKKT